MRNIFYTTVYRIAIGAYSTGVRIAASFNHKAKLFVTGRKDIFTRMRAAIGNDNRKSIWMHCASLGEFEQGRPVFEALREQYPQYRYVVTFFSPSGYEVRKTYGKADHVFYLPIDTNSNAKAFLDIVQPALCLFVKYEFWYFYLENIAKRKIPLVSVSAVFNERQGFFKWYGGLQREMLHCFSHLFVQDEGSKQLLLHIGIKHVTISGDTRFDRVIKAAEQHVELPIATSFAHGHKVLVAGSTWKEDEEFLRRVLDKLPHQWKLILVPHEVDDDHIAEIEELYAGKMVRWSAGGDVQDKRVLVVDKVGLLLQLYKYGNVAWIGGGFGKEGVHNVLEAAVYGMPCFYGPIFHQFIEAQELITRGGGFTTSDPADLVASLAEMKDSIRYKQHCDAARDYVMSKAGATPLVVKYVSKFLK